MPPSRRRPNKGRKRVQGSPLDISRDVKDRTDHVHHHDHGQRPILPPELLRNIVEEIAISDSKHRNRSLYILSLTSWVFYAEARRVLYREVTLINGTPGASQIRRALEAGATKYVQSLHIESYNGASGRRGRSAKMDFLHAPLHGMDNLRSLSISNGGAEIRRTAKLFDFLDASLTHDSLLRFHAPVTINNRLFGFLERQSKISDLFVWDVRSSFDDTLLRSHQFLPVLNRLKFQYLPWHGFTDFVQDRPVIALCLDSLWEFPEYWDAFATRLTALDLSNAVFDGDGAPQITQTIVSTAVNLRLFASYRLLSYSGKSYRSFSCRMSE